jgi:hypothetical protein
MGIALPHMFHAARMAGLASLARIPPRPGSPGGAGAASGALPPEQIRAQAHAMGFTASENKAGGWDFVHHSGGRMVQMNGGTVSSADMQKYLANMGRSRMGMV